MNILNINKNFEKSFKKDDLIWEKTQSFDFNGIKVDFIFEVRNNPIHYSNATTGRTITGINALLGNLIVEWQIERYARFTMPNGETMLSLIGAENKSFDKEELKEKVTKIKSDFKLFYDRLNNFCTLFPKTTENLINSIIEGDIDMPFGRFMLNTELVNTIGLYHLKEVFNTEMIERGFLNKLLYETQKGYNLDKTKEEIKDICIKINLNDKLNAKLPEKNKTKQPKI